MNHKILAVCILATAGLAGCQKPADTLPLADGRSLSLPSDVDVNAWGAENIKDTDLQLAEQACKARQDKSDRLRELCSTVERRHSINSL